MTATETKAAIDSRVDFFRMLHLSPEKTFYTEEEIEEYNQKLEKYIEAEVRKRVSAIEAKLAENDEVAEDEPEATEKNKVAEDESLATEKRNSLSSEVNEDIEDAEKAEKTAPEKSEELLVNPVNEINNNVEKADVDNAASASQISSVIKKVEKAPATILSTDFDDVAGTPAKSVHKYLSKDRDELSFLFEDFEREYKEMRSENDRLKEENDRMAFELDDSKNKLKVFEKIRQRNKEKKSNA